MANALNYAVEYTRSLVQWFPHVLHYGKLYATPNNGRFRWVNAKTIEIPSISTTGRVDANRDTIVQAQRNYDNSWEPYTLTHERKWSTLVHPMDIVQTNLTTTIANITQAFNEFQKFPEMDAYCISKIFADWQLCTDEEGHARSVDHTVLTTENILQTTDDMMLSMDNERVPSAGRVLYCTYEVHYMLKRAEDFARSYSVQSGGTAITRDISRIEELEIIPVPAQMMKTAYEFTTGWKVAADAKQINLFLVHPVAVITPVSYTFSRLDEPSAGSEGKYIYYEESFEDVFVLSKRAGAIRFNTEA